MGATVRINYSQPLTSSKRVLIDMILNKKRKEKNRQWKQGDGFKPNNPGSIPGTHIMERVIFSSSDFTCVS